MSEYEPFQDPQKDGQNDKSELDSIRKRLDIYTIGGLMGVMFGGVGMGGSYALGFENPVRVGTSIFAGLVTSYSGIRCAYISLHEAQDFKDAGKKFKTGLKVTQAVIEKSLGFSVPLGLITSINGVEFGAGFGIAGALLGAKSALEDWNIRNKKFPELVTPEGNSMQLEDSYPERVQGFRMPPVFSADSIKDVIEFREANKEKIVKWSHSYPFVNDLLPVYNSLPPLLSSVVLLPKVRHHPVMDPEDKNFVTLVDGNTKIDAYKVEDSDPVWPDSTIFDNDILSSERRFNESEWLKWRNKSWREDIAILCQYRQEGKRGIFFDKKDLTNVKDYYWLVDIFVDEDGYHEEEPEESVEKAKGMLPNFQPMPF